MYTRMVLIFAAASCLLQRSAIAQCDDPFDMNLCVYQLTPTEQAQFSLSDGAISPFWSKWGDWYGMDRADLFGPDACYPDSCSLTDSADARMVTKAAATEHGLYLCIEIEDDVWVPDTGGDTLQCDRVVLFFEQLPRDELWDCGWVMGCPPLAYTAWQIDLPVHTAVVPRMHIGWYSVDVWARAEAFMSLDSAAAVFGIQTEQVVVGPTSRVQEWYIPWRTYCGGFAPGTSLAGRDLAFSGGYTDRDDWLEAPDLLRVAQKDPLGLEYGDGMYWGELEMPGDMPPVGPQQAVLGPQGMRAQPVRTVARREMHDLRGRRLSHTATLPASVVIELQASGIGTVRRVWVGR